MIYCWHGIWNGWWYLHGHRSASAHCITNCSSVMQSQKVVSAYFTIKQIPPFGFAELRASQWYQKWFLMIWAEIVRVYPHARCQIGVASWQLGSGGEPMFTVIMELSRAPLDNRQRRRSTATTLSIVRGTPAGGAAASAGGMAVTPGVGCPPWQVCTRGR